MSMLLEAQNPIDDHHQKLKNLEQKLESLAGIIEEALKELRAVLGQPSIAENQYKPVNFHDKKSESSVICDLRSKFYKIQSHQLPMYISDEDLQALEKILHSGLLSHYSITRPQIILLHLLRKEAGKCLTIKQCAERSGYSEATLYVALSTFSQKMIFTKNPIQSKRLGKGQYEYQMWLANEMPQEIDTESNDLNELKYIVNKHALECGYSTDLCIENLSAITKRGLSYILTQRKNGKREIPFADIASQTGRMLMKDFEYEISYHLSCLLPHEWRTYADSTNRALKFEER